MPYKTTALFERAQISVVRSCTARMWFVSLYAAAVVTQSALGDNGGSFFIALATLGAALLTEFLVGLKTGKHTLLDGSAAASALVLALLLPNQTPPLFAAFGAVFAILIVKISFGGLGANWLNPAVSGWLFVRFSWPDTFDRAVDGSPLSFLVNKIINGGGHPIGSAWEIMSQNGFIPNANTITKAFNDKVFAVFNMELPARYLDFFYSPGAGIIGDRGVYTLLLGSIFMAAFGITRFYIPAVYLAVYALLVRFAGALPTGGGLWNGDIFLGVLSGGALITAFLLLPDPATGPKSAQGKIVFAVAAAALTFFFRYMKDESYGAFFAVALLNVLTPFVHAVEKRMIYLRAGGAGVNMNSRDSGER
jgi:electron transport complex protein RnfD